MNFNVIGLSESISSILNINVKSSSLIVKQGHEPLRNNFVLFNVVFTISKEIEPEDFDKFGSFIIKSYQIFSNEYDCEYTYEAILVRGENTRKMLTNLSNFVNQ